MSEENELTSQIEAMVRAEFAPLQKRFAEDQAFTDDEYVERYFDLAKKNRELANASGSKMPEIRVPTREELLRSRNSRLRNPATLDDSMRFRAEQLSICREHARK